MQIVRGKVNYSRDSLMGLKNGSFVDTMHDQLIIPYFVSDSLKGRQGLRPNYQLLQGLGSTRTVQQHPVTCLVNVELVFTSTETLDVHFSVHLKL